MRLPENVERHSLRPRGYISEGYGGAYRISRVTPGHRLGPWEAYGSSANTIGAYYRAARLSALATAIPRPYPGHPHVGPNPFNTGEN